MITEQLLKQLKVTQAITPTAGAAGATDIEGATIDMQNFEGCLFEAVMGVITAGAVTGLQVQGSNSSDMSGAVTLAGTQVAVADDADGNVYLIDVFRPGYRYVRLHVDRATQNAVVASASAAQYGGKTLPNPSHGSAVVATSVVSPAAA